MLCLIMSSIHKLLFVIQNVTLIYALILFLLVYDTSSKKYCKIIQFTKLASFLHTLSTSDDTYYTPGKAINFLWFNIKPKIEKRKMLAFGLIYNQYRNQNRYNLE